MSPRGLAGADHVRRCAKYGTQDHARTAELLLRRRLRRADHATYILLIPELIDPAAGVPAKAQRNMHYRSIPPLVLFGSAAIVALKYPYVGLGICCCCLIGYLRPAAPGAA